MSDPTDRLRIDLHDAVDGLSPSSRLDDVVRHRVRRRVRRNRVASAGAMLAATALVVVGVMVVPRGGGGPPSVVAGPGGETTAAAPSTSPPPTLPAVPPAGAVRVEGSFSGRETYSFTDGGCPDLDHVLNATFQLVDGTPWQYRSDYCGELDGEMWSGSGAFTFTAPDGSTITGTRWVRPVAVPAAGGPDLLTITGGTGIYDGASGSCVLDDHIVQVQIGVQDHDGTFTCDITP